MIWPFLLGINIDFSGSKLTIYFSAMVYKNESD